MDLLGELSSNSRAKAVMVTVAVLELAFIFPQPVYGAAPQTIPGAVDVSIFRSPTSGPAVATGALTDDHGNATSGTVAALAWPDEILSSTFKVGDRIPTPTVGWTSAKGDGTFTLRIDPRRLPAGYLSSSGHVNLNVFAWNGGRFADWSMSSQLASPSTYFQSLSVNRSDVPTLRLALKAQIAPSVGTIVSRPDVAGCGYYTLISTSLAWDDAGESLPFYSSTTSWFSLGSSHSVTLGVATSFNGTYGSWSASGSYTVSSGVLRTWDSSSDDRYYQVQTQYGKYSVSCYGYRVLPIKDTGQSATVIKGWQNWCRQPWIVSEPANFTFQRSGSSGYHYSLGGGVLTGSWIGLNLSYDTDYGSDNATSYHFVSPSKLCGNNDYPTYAGRITDNAYA
ncbi:MAG: hypothetical protein ABI959_03530 [Candidatus Dormiibacterota bacterium]